MAVSTATAHGAVLKLRTRPQIRPQGTCVFEGIGMCGSMRRRRKVLDGKGRCGRRRPRTGPSMTVRMTAMDDGGWGASSSAPASEGEPGIVSGVGENVDGEDADCVGTSNRQRNVFVDVGRARFLFYRYFNTPGKWFRKYLYETRVEGTPHGANPPMGACTCAWHESVFDPDGSM